jgi:hypothetical protein
MEPTKNKEIIPLQLYDSQQFTVDFIWLFNAAKLKESGGDNIETRTLIEIKFRLQTCYNNFFKQNSHLIGNTTTEDTNSIPQVAFCSPEACSHALKEHTAEMKCVTHGLPKDFESLWCLRAPMSQERSSEGRRPSLAIKREADAAHYFHAMSLVNYLENPKKKTKMPALHQGKSTVPLNTETEVNRWRNLDAPLYSSILYTHAVLRAMKRFPLPGSKGNNAIHASHKCNNSWCGLNSHLAIEPATINEERKQCAGIIICMICFEIIAEVCIHRDEPCIKVCLTLCGPCKEDNDGSSFETNKRISREFPAFEKALNKYRA